MAIFGPPNVEKLKRKGDINGLINALSYKSTEVIKQAARALGAIRDPEAVEMLIATLHYKGRSSSDDERGVVDCAAWALGEIGDPRAVDALVSVIYPFNPSAAVALGKIGDAQAVEPLIDILDSDTGMIEPHTKKLVATALGDIGDKRAVKPLISAYEGYENYDGDVAEAAAIALRKIGDPRANEVLTSFTRKSEERKKELNKRRKEAQKIQDIMDKHRKL